MAAGDYICGWGAVLEGGGGHCYLTHGCYSDIETNCDHCPIASIFGESQGLFQMQLEIWNSCYRKTMPLVWVPTVRPEV